MQQVTEPAEFSLCVNRFEGDEKVGIGLTQSCKPRNLSSTNALGPFRQTEANGFPAKISGEATYSISRNRDTATNELCTGSFAPESGTVRLNQTN